MTVASFRQAPIGDDNYLHLAGAGSGAGVDCVPFVWRTWRGAADCSAGVDLDGVRLATLDLGSSTESLRLARTDDRSSGKSAGSGYLAMSRVRPEPADEDDAGCERPRRPPKPARLSPARAPSAAAAEYVEVERRAPEPPPRCREYELMADFMSAAAPPAVPPRGRARVAPPDPPRPASADDSLLDELQRDDYCVLKVCEDESPDDPSPTGPAEPRADPDPEPEPFSRLSVHRKSNPTKTQPSAAKSMLKTSSSTSNVHDAGSTGSRPLAERLTPFFLKRKSKQPEESGATPRKEDNLIGRLTPRFGQSRLMGRGKSLELAPADGHPKRIERSATAVNIPTRPMNSSIVANLKFFSLHRYGASVGGGGASEAAGAHDEVQCRGFARNDHETESAPPAAAAHAASPDEEAWRAPAASGALLAATTNDIRL